MEAPGGIVSKYAFFLFFSPVEFKHIYISERINSQYCLVFVVVFNHKLKLICFSQSAPSPVSAESAVDLF